MEIVDMETRELRSYIDRHKPTLATRVDECKAGADELDEDSSVIDVDRVLDDMRRMESLGNKIGCYCRNVVGRRNWTALQILPNDETVSDERMFAARTDESETKTKVKTTIKYCEGKIRIQKEAAAKKEARTNFRILREARLKEEAAFPSSS